MRQRARERSRRVALIPKWHHFVPQHDWPQPRLWARRVVRLCGFTFLPAVVDTQRMNDRRTPGAPPHQDPYRAPRRRAQPPAASPGCPDGGRPAHHPGRAPRRCAPGQGNHDRSARGNRTGHPYGSSRLSSPASHPTARQSCRQRQAERQPAQGQPHNRRRERPCSRR